MSHGKIDFLIIGQGLAGSVLAELLIRRKKKIVVIDDNRPMTSSKVAVGLVNPITGRRFVLTWKFHELSSFARSFYRGIENEFGEKILQEMPIVRCVDQNQFLDDIFLKIKDDDYAQYLSDKLPKLPDYYFPSDHMLSIQDAFRVNIQAFTDLIRRKLNQFDQFDSRVFDYNDIKFYDDHVAYNDYHAKQIIFCEGAAATKNPFFSELPFQPTKGELFELRQKNKLSYAFKKGLTSVPISTDLLWVGALNFWDYNNESPTDEGERILLEKLRKLYKQNPYIERHLAAIRPTVKDRRPFLGRHPKYPRLAIFNGLGTKGTSLAPFFADRLLNHLLEDAALPKEVNIERFGQWYST